MILYTLTNSCIHTSKNSTPHTVGDRAKLTKSRSQYLPWYLVPYLEEHEPGCRDVSVGSQHLVPHKVRPSGRLERPSFDIEKENCALVHVVQCVRGVRGGAQHVPRPWRLCLCVLGGV